MVINSTLEPRRRAQGTPRAARCELELVLRRPREGDRGPLRRFIAESRQPGRVDEAHRISHWGNDSAPPARRLFGRAQGGKLATSPSWPPDRHGDGLPRATSSASWGCAGPMGSRSFFRPNLHITAQKKAGPQHPRRHPGIRRRHAPVSGIVYRLSRKAVESTAAWHWGFQGQGRPLSRRVGAPGARAPPPRDVLSRATRSTSWSPPWPGWASTRATSGSWSTGTCRRASRPGTRDRLAEGMAPQRLRVLMIPFNQPPTNQPTRRRKTVEINELADWRGCRHQAITAYPTSGSIRAARRVITAGDRPDAWWHPSGSPAAEGRFTAGGPAGRRLFEKPGPCSGSLRRRAFPPTSFSA